jgi:SAM-dependent methyltransferase
MSSPPTSSAGEPFDASAFRGFEWTGWQRAAAHYPTTFGNLTSQAVGSVLDAVGVHRGVELLDVAAGPGYLAAAAADRGAIVHGIDFSPAMVAEAQRRHPALTFTEGDAEHLTFPDRRFDAVAMNFGMLHLARPDRALAEAYRVLRPGGRDAFTVWAAPEQAVGFGAVLRAIEAHGRMDVELPKGPPFFLFSDPAESRRRLLAAGFVQPEVRQLPLVWQVPSAEVAFDAVSRGGVRTAAVLAAQSPEALARIRQAAASALQKYARGEMLAVPMPAVLASASKA